MLLLFLLVATFSVGFAGKGNKNNNRNKNGKGDRSILVVIQNQVLNNQTLLPILISALNSSGWSQLIVNSGGYQFVNFTGMSQYSFFVLPAISSFLSQYISPSLSYLNQSRLNLTLSLIQVLTTNQTLLNILIGDLMSNGYVIYVQGSAGSQNVNFTSLVNNTAAAAILNRFISRQVKQQMNSKTLLIVKPSKFLG